MHQQQERLDTSIIFLCHNLLSSEPAVREHAVLAFYDRFANRLADYLREHLHYQGLPDAEIEAALEVVLTMSLRHVYVFNGSTDDDMWVWLQSIVAMVSRPQAG